MSSSNADYAEAEGQLLQIYEALKRLRHSEAPILQAYALTVMAETRAVLAHVSLTAPPDRMLEWE